MLLEAVPNLSLGPEDPALQAVLERLAAAASPGWAHLDTHSDPDHQRTVLTMAGAPTLLARALVAMVEAAADHGRLKEEGGVHPRTGLVDVVPLVPLEAAREADARRVAWRVGDALARSGIPVHAYGRLATRPEHATLAPIRRAHRRGPHPAPERGPPDPHRRLGCSCVGVRDLLIAYNVVLDTVDLEAGEAIARNLRETSGPEGLPGVQALAFPLASRGGVIQVSCNLTRVEEVGPARVYQRVHALAAEFGVAVAGGELVGLAPRRALPDDPVSMGLGTRVDSLEDRLGACGLPTGTGTPW